jgi:hypothetical protein
MGTLADFGKVAEKHTPTIMSNQPTKTVSISVACVPPPKVTALEWEADPEGQKIAALKNVCSDPPVFDLNVYLALTIYIITEPLGFIQLKGAALTLSVGFRVSVKRLACSS